MERYICGDDLFQTTIEPLCLDDMISSDNPVRAIAAIVERMDIALLGFTYSQTKETGRKPYDPVDMFKLYAYSYFNGLRSSRKIQRECTRNIEVMWLTGNLVPHYKTIANFRRDNKEAIKKAFRRFSLICDELGLLGKEMIAVDGSKFRANNGRNAWYNPKKVATRLAYYRSAAEKYMELLEAADAEETAGSGNDIKNYRNKLDHILSRIKELETIEKQIDEQGEVSLTDTDSRLMKLSNGGCGICHNVQIATDSKNHLVVAIDVVSDPGDKLQLSHMSGMAKEELGVDKLTVLADTGYYAASEFAACDGMSIEPLVSKPVNEKTAVNGEYAKSKFRYDSEQDAYICPQGHALHGKERRSASKTPGIRYNNPAACRSCIVKGQCTTHRYRCIYDRPFQRYADEVDRNTYAKIALYKKRQEIVEHPFGTVKSGLGFACFLTRGTENVRTESLLHFLAYNMKRAINIMGTHRLTTTL